MSFAPFVAPVKDATWKQEACAEFDASLADLQRAVERLFQAGFALDHAVNEAAELVADDPELYGCRAEDITEDQGIQARVKLLEVSPVTGDNELLGSVFFRLHDMLEGSIHSLELPVPNAVPDNDEPQCLGSAVLMTCQRLGLYQGYRVMGYKLGGGDTGSDG